MKEKLIELLGLEAKADEAAIIKAVAAAQGKIKQLEQVIAASKPSQRELLIRKKMEITGMTREMAEHVVDQQAREDKARKGSKK